MVPRNARNARRRLGQEQHLEKILSVRVARRQATRGDIDYQQDQIKEVGLGFELPESLFGLRKLQILDATAAAQ